MATQVQWRKGTTAQHATFTGAPAEITVDTDKHAIVVHDGVTAGGFPALNANNAVAKTSSTGSAIIPSGTTAQRDVSPNPGWMRFNTTTGTPEIYNGTSWGPFATGMPIFGPGSIPPTDVGPIYVSTIGLMTFYNGAYAPNNLSKGTRSNPSMTSTSTTVTVNPGKWRSSDDQVDLILSSALTKVIQTSGSWTAGNNQNGLFSGVKANSTWYEVFLIRNNISGAVDVGFDTSATAVNRPSGWTAYQLLGSVFVDASGNIKSFIQVSAYDFLWVARTLDVNGGAADNTTGTAHTLSVPIRRRVMANIGALLDAGSPTNVLSVSAVDAVPASVGTGGAVGDVYRAATPTQHFNTFEVLTSNSGQVIAKAGSGGIITSAVSIGTRGWRELF